MSFLSGMRERRGASYYQEAVRLARLGRPDKALAALNRVIELAPGHAEAYYLRGLQLSRLGHPAEALADFGQVCALMPGQTDADYQRGIQLSRLSRHDEALAAVDEFLRRVPGNTDALLLRGSELSELGRHEDALEAFDEVLSGDSGHAVAHHNRAAILTKLGRRDEALAAHERAVAAAPEEIYFRIQKGKALVAAGELDSARDEFDTVSRLRPQDAGEAEAWAAAIVWHQGDAQAARERFTKVKGHLTGGSAKSAMLEAIALCALGDPGAAEQALRHGRIGTTAHEDFDRLCELLSDPPMPGIDRLRAADS